MSAENNFIATLALIQTNLYRFGGPILMSVGTVSCILSLIVFTKRNIRKNPCSIYLVAFNISSFLLIFTSLLFGTLANGYKIDPTVYNLSFCHFRLYTILLFDVLTPSYLILASIDRMLITSRNALTRQRSTRRLAFICIITVTLFWLLCHIHALFLTNIRLSAPGVLLCYFQTGIYLVFIGYYLIIVKGILIPLIMLISGLYTIKNIRKVGRIEPVSRSISTTGLPCVHSKDRQLVRILFVNISVYILFSLMILIVLMYQQITQQKSVSLVYTRTQTFLVTVGTFSAYIPCCIECYTNLLVSKTFRHEVKKIFI